MQLLTGAEWVSSLRSTIDQLRKIGENLADPMYTIEKHAAAYDLLLARYAKFHVGDRVQLVSTPAISDVLSPGWLGSKHFLVAGAYGTVRDVDVRKGMFYYQVFFDSESWRDSQGIQHVVAPDERHSYCFGEGYLVTACGLQSPITHSHIGGPVSEYTVYQTAVRQIAHLQDDCARFRGGLLALKINAAQLSLSPNLDDATRQRLARFESDIDQLLAGHPS